MLRSKNFFATQLLERELRVDPEFCIDSSLPARYSDIWRGRCDLRCLQTARMASLNPYCAYYTENFSEVPADVHSLRAMLYGFALYCESDDCGAVCRLRGERKKVSLLEPSVLFPERRRLQRCCRL